MICHSKNPIDPETELPTIPGDLVSQEIRDAELIGKKELLRLAWDRAMAEGWGRSPAPYGTGRR